MTEPEWLGCADPWPMLQFVKNRASNRKLRLFTCACLKTIAHLITDPGRLRVVETAERWADGRATDAEARQTLGACSYDSTIAWTSGHSAAEQAANRTAGCALFASAQEAAETAAWNIVKFSRSMASTAKGGSSVYPALLRDMIGNPFRTVDVAPRWLTATVVSLAQAIYDERAFDRMPILADALEEAGCIDASISEHCRSGGKHVRGCWVVDLVLGKE